tara:strand:- start:1217 stop:1366 length:150 start_codon:yes stop_codon:yes gene_type:complete
MPQERIIMTKHRDIAIPASAPVSIIAPTGAPASYYYYGYYFGSFSGRYA